MQPGARKAPISVYIAFAITIVVIGSIALLSGFAYLESRSQLIEIENDHQRAVENALVEYNRLMDRDLAFFDDLFTEQLQAAFPAFLAEYQRANGNPYQMDLDRLKADLGPSYDLYVIDSSGVIIATTFKDELGFDLTSYPGIEETLTAMRMGPGFVSDRVVQEKVNGSYRKYAYYPTPDHRYLLEIGLKDNSFSTARKRLYTTISVDDLKQRSPSLLNVTVYNVLKRPIRAPNGTRPLDASALSEAIAMRGAVETMDTANETLARYVFVDLRDSAYASDPSLVLEMVYTTKQLQDAINLLGLEHVLIALLAVVLGALFAAGAATLVAKPMRGLVEDIERIADGDLDHTLTDGGSAELWSLRVSIGRLTAQLLEQLAAVRQSEQRVREQNEALELRVEERTRELAEANEEAHLYIDIMTHDLSGTLGTSLSLVDALAAEVEGESCEKTARLQATLQQGSRIIDQVARVERISHLDQPLETILLDRAIRDGIARHPDMAVRYEGTDERVLADGFLSEVFANLLGDSRHYGGSGVNCRIRVEPRGEEVLISLEDDGPGISAREKERLFARRARVRGGEPAEPVLGLSIAGALVRRYGGRIWADDRVGGYARGAVIRITLRRVPPGTGAAPDEEPAA